MQFIEALFGQVLAGIGKNEIAVVDAQLFAPAGIKQCGIDCGHAGDVRVSLCRNVEAASPGSFDQRNAIQGIAQASAVDVNDVQRGACDRGRTNHFLHRFDGGARLHASGATQVGVDGQLALGGHAEHVDDLEASRAGRVLDAHADAECAGIEFLAQALLNAFDLFGRGRLVGSGSAFRQDRTFG